MKKAIFVFLGFSVCIQIVIFIFFKDSDGGSSSNSDCDCKEEVDETIARSQKLGMDEEALREALVGSEYYDGVEKNIEEYNFYASKRAHDYGKLHDVFLVSTYLCEHGDYNQVFFDVGGNVGHFTDMIFQLHGEQRLFDIVKYWKEHEIDISASRFQMPTDSVVPVVHVFEPEPNNYRALRDSAKRYPKGHMVVHHAAVADQGGTMPMYDGGTSGRNSGNAQGGLIRHGKKITDVKVLSLDDFIEEQQISKIAMVKIDVEGFEYEVFQGMQHSVEQGVIDLFMFEFGEKWTKNYGREKSVSLKQALDLIDSWGFDTFLIGQFNNVKLNGKGYDQRYENTKKFISMEMFSISRRHPKYLCIVTGLRSSPSKLIGMPVAKGNSGFARRAVSDVGAHLSLIMGGDLLLSDRKRENVAMQRQLSNCERIASTRRQAEAWGGLLPVFERADAVFANLETSISEREFNAFVHPSGFVKGTKKNKGGFQALPFVLDILKVGHISAVSLSNKHILDIPTGVEDTISALDDAQIQYAGAGMTLAHAKTFPTVHARNHEGTKIAFLSASDLRSIRDEKTGWDEDANFVKAFRATSSSPGIWDVATADGAESLALHFNDADFAHLEQQIKKAREGHDLVVFYLHFQPNVAGFQAAEPFKALARRIVDAGVDIFVGQHPHHMQEFDFHRGRPMLMGVGEMLRSYGNPSFAMMDNEHHIVYNIQWPVKDREAKVKKVSIDLILVKTDTSACTVDIELDLSSARERVRRINPGKVFTDTENGLRYTARAAVSYSEKLGPAGG